MSRKFDWDDIATIRSQAAGKLRRAELKRKKAKTAPEAKAHKRLSTLDKFVPRFDENSKTYLLKSAKLNEQQAATLNAAASKMERILKAAKDARGAA